MTFDHFVGQVQHRAQLVSTHEAPRAIDAHLNVGGTSRLRRAVAVAQGLERALRGQSITANQPAIPT